MNFFGNVAVSDDLINSRTNVNIKSLEPTSGGTLNPSAIAITTEATPYNPVIQSGPMTFALDVANSTYNLGFGDFRFYVRRFGADVER